MATPFMLVKYTVVTILLNSHLILKSKYLLTNSWPYKGVLLHLYRDFFASKHFKTYDSMLAMHHHQINL